MKKIVATLFIALAMAAVAFAQIPAQEQETVTVSGKLELIDGYIGLKSGGTTYYVRGLERLVGFIKDLQEGAQVKLVGYAYPLGLPSGYSMLVAAKVTVGGKDYDLPKAGIAGRRGMAGNYGQGMMDMNGRGGAMGGRGARR